MQGDAGWYCQLWCRLRPWAVPRSLLACLRLHVLDTEHCQWIAPQQLWWCFHTTTTRWQFGQDMLLTHSTITCLSDLKKITPPREITPSWSPHGGPWWPHPARWWPRGAPWCGRLHPAPLWRQAIPWSPHGDPWWQHGTPRSPLNTGGGCRCKRSSGETDSRNYNT